MSSQKHFSAVYSHIFLCSSLFTLAQSPHFFQYDLFPRICDKHLFDHSIELLYHLIRALLLLRRFSRKIPLLRATRPVLKCLFRRRRRLTILRPLTLRIPFSTPSTATAVTIPTVPVLLAIELLSEQPPQHSLIVPLLQALLERL